MKKYIFLLPLFFMMYINNFAGNGLKDGVYGFETSYVDSTRFIYENISEYRFLIVKGDTAIYKMNRSSGPAFGKYMLSGTYFLILKENSEDLYESEYMEQNDSLGMQVKLRILDNDNIELEILSGTVLSIYSGGQYFRRILPLIPETLTLPFIEDLKVEDHLLKGITY